MAVKPETYVFIIWNTGMKWVMPQSRLDEVGDTLAPFIDRGRIVDIVDATREDYAEYSIGYEKRRRRPSQ
jgi:hypothetical protein